MNIHVYDCATDAPRKVNEIDRALAGSGGAPLTNQQKRSLCMWARDAFLLVQQSGSSLKERDFTAWRHMQQQFAVGREHLTDCMQSDYNALKARFLFLAGRPAAAQAATVRAATDPLQRARKILMDTYAEVTDVIQNPAGYVFGIAKSRRWPPPDQCSPKQIWSLIFTLRARAQKRRGALKHHED